MNGAARLAQGCVNNLAAWTGDSKTGDGDVLLPGVAVFNTLCSQPGTTRCRLRLSHMLAGT
jgi:hypothetical protein